MLIKSFWSFSLWLSELVANQLIGEGGGRECGFSGLGWMQLLTQPFSHTLYRLKHPSCGMPLSTFNFVLKKKISQLLNPKFTDKLVTLLEWLKKKKKVRNLWISGTDWIVERLIFSHRVNNNADAQRTFFFETICRSVLLNVPAVLKWLPFLQLV